MSEQRAAEGRRKFNLSEWAIGQQSLVIFLMLISVAAGIWSYVRLSRNEDPAFTIKTMVVAASWPGATTEDTTRFVTDKLELKLEETPYLDRLESYTKSGESVVFVNLRDDTPPSAVQDVWYQVRKKMADVAPALPNGVQGPIFDDEFGDTFGIIFGFTAEGFSERELRDRVDTVRAALLQTPDIGKAILLGVQEEQIVVEFSPAGLAAHNLDPDTVLQALAAQNAVAPSGVVRLPDEKVALRVSGAFTSEESVRAIILRIGERYVPLTDLATVARRRADPAAPMFRVDGQPAIGLAVSMAPAGNLLDFGRAIREKMAAVAETLPHGIEVHEVADQSAVVQGAVGGFVKVLVEAIVIVLVVSFLSLGLRAGLVVSISIPLVLALTFVGMDIAGIGLQRVSLGALIIALGLLVDDAMITVEAMVSKLESGWSVKRAATYAYESTAFPMLTGTLVMIAGFVPVGFAASSAGEYCFSLFLVVLISLLASWIVAVLFSPLIGTWVLPRALPAHAHGEGRMLGWLQRAVRWTFARSWSTAAICLVALAAAVFGSTKLEQQFFPQSDRPDLLVSVTLPQNASLEATSAKAEQVEALLKDDPNVDHYSTYVGSGAIRFYLPMDVLLTNDNVTQVVVVTKSLEARDAVRAKLEAAFETTLSDTIARAMPLELGPPVGWPLKYRVTGPDVAKSREYAMQLANVVAENPNARDVNLSSGEPQKSVQVRVRQSEARALGLSSQDVASVLATTFSGAAVTSVRDGNRMVDVVVRGAHGERQDMATLVNLQIPTPGGKRVPLGQVADIAYGVEEPIIWRRRREPVVTVQADVVAGIQPQTVSEQLAPEVERFRSQLPQGYAVQEGGAAEESEKGNQSVFAVVPAMIGIIVTLLMLQLRSFSRTAIAMLTAPFGLIGIVAAMLPTHTPMGFVAQLGVIALAGMIIRNAVILIEEVDGNVAAGKAPADAILAAVAHRARPILLTACAAILGMVPIASQVFWGPMAYAIIGGLTAATIMTLTVLPCALFALLGWEARARAKSSADGDPDENAAAISLHDASEVVR
ncbi:efflux RND transporter permease subunit [Pendulispora albinea]|uniref:Efflux RND transporter permease subunit n=1 Tax=Pendulispora albinea TaxID=2741071 RepID=A0ABZ2LWG9_9BACT